MESSGEVGLPLHAIENESRLMIDMACQKAIYNNIPPQSIQVRFSRRFLKKQYRKQVSTVLYDYVASNFAAPGEVKSGVKDHLPKEIVYITMCGLKDSGHQWNGPSSGWINSNYIEGFQSAIVKKEALLSNYLKRCDNCWLVTVATHAGGSSFIEWSKELAAYDFSAKFKRVFFVQGLEQTAYELKLAAETSD